MKCFSFRFANNCMHQNMKFCVRIFQIEILEIHELHCKIKKNSITAIETNLSKCSIGCNSDNFQQQKTERRKKETHKIVNPWHVFIHEIDEFFKLIFLQFLNRKQ